MDRFFNKLALTAKIEAVYGTDAAPTGAANAMLVTEVQFTPLEATEESRNLYRPYFGEQGSLLATEHVTISYKVELAGSGAAGTAPAWGPLIRACGMAETITEDTDVAYNPISSGFEAVSQYFYLDGVLHKFVGSRGNVKLSLTPQKIPYLEFSFMGLLGAISDTALPAVTLTGFIEAVLVSKANTPVFSLHGYSAIAESLSIDLGAKVEPRFLIGEESMKITDRKTTGTAVIVASSLADKDWVGIARARTKGALAIQHGTVAGNIVEIEAPKVQLGKPSYGQTQNVVNYSLPLTFTPDAGSDELTITVR